MITTNEMNIYLQEAEKIYAAIDQGITQLINTSVTTFKYDASILRKLNQIDDIKIKNYLNVIYNELQFFSQERYLHEIKEYYEKNFDEYYFRRYNNTNETIKLLHSRELTTFETNSILDNDFVVDDLSFVNQVLDKARDLRGLDNTIKTIKISPTKNTMAYYNYREKTVYINPTLTGTYKNYVLIHELMHHIHFSIFTSLYYISEFDFGAGYREGVAINLSERIINHSFPRLLHEHQKYLEFAQIRGVIAHNIFTEKLSLSDFIQHLPGNVTSEMATLQYISCIKHPGYKETYFPNYYILHNIDTHKLIHMPYI